MKLVYTLLSVKILMVVCCHVYTIIMVIFMLLYKVCLIQTHCVLCSCIVFKLIVYGRVPMLYSGLLCKVVFMYCIYSGSLCMVMFIYCIRLYYVRVHALCFNI